MKRHDYILPLLLLVVICLRIIPGGGMWYFSSLYPTIASIMGWISGTLPIDYSNIFYFVGISYLILYPIFAIAKRQTKKKVVFCNEIKMILWLFVWFNLAWGINYKAPNFYQRAKVMPAKYDAKQLKTFAFNYLEKLNAAYCKVNTIDEKTVALNTIEAYRKLSDSAGIHAPFNDHPQAKTMLFTPLYSKVGVLGSMGPFYGEFRLNGDLLPVEYPDCWAHEYAHSLGIAREGEATFYAYLACTSSNDQRIRFSGYMSILPYILRSVMAEDEQTGKDFIAQIRPEIKQLYNEKQEYWRAKYSRTIGEIQDYLLDTYLKSNHVEGGIHNYSEVVGLIISWEARKK